MRRRTKASRQDRFRIWLFDSGFGFCLVLFGVLVLGQREAQQFVDDALAVALRPFAEKVDLARDGLFNIRFSTHGILLAPCSIFRLLILLKRDQIQHAIAILAVLCNSILRHPVCIKRKKRSGVTRIPWQTKIPPQDTRLTCSLREATILNGNEFGILTRYCRR